MSTAPAPWDEDVAAFAACVDAIPVVVDGKDDRRARVGVERFGVSALVHLDPPAAVARLGTWPRPLQLLVLERAASEGRAPTPLLARAVADALRGMEQRGVDELALGLWAGTDDAEARLLEDRAGWHWQAVATAIAWGVPSDRVAADAFAVRLAEPGPGLDRARLGLIRRWTQSPDEATDAVARLEHPAIRLEGLYELARRDLPSASLAQRWLTLAEPFATATPEAELAASTLGDLGRALRLTTILARAGHPDAPTHWARALAAVERTPPAARAVSHATFLTAAATLGVTPMRSAVERLASDRNPWDAGSHARLWSTVIETLFLLRPHDSIAEVLSDVTEAAWRRVPDGPERIGLLARLVHTATLTAARPVDAWVAALADRLRRLHVATTPIEETQLVLAARLVGAGSPALGRALLREPVAPVHRGLWAAGLVQSHLEPPAMITIAAASSVQSPPSP